MDVLLGETLQRLGLGEFLDEVLGETAAVVTGNCSGCGAREDTAPWMTRGRFGCGVGEKCLLHMLEIRPKEVRLCNFVYNICSN